jgi:hypothetical protein
VKSVKFLFGFCFFEDVTRAMPASSEVVDDSFDLDDGDRLFTRLQELESSHRKQQELLLREQVKQREMLAAQQKRVSLSRESKKFSVRG